ncbi:MAG: regulatory protein RecX [Burkholderiales bacterium]|nr:regulatory protein RecX [Burkholderiales bacterium]
MAFSYLSRREYGQIELFNKLKQYSADEGMISQVLQELVDKGYLSDLRYIKGYLARKSNKYGLLKLKYDLLQKVSDVELINEVVKEANLDEVAQATQILIKKFGLIAKTSDDKFKQTKFLTSRGFSFDIVRQVFSREC